MVFNFLSGLKNLKYLSLNFFVVGNLYIPPKTEAQDFDFIILFELFSRSRRDIYQAIPKIPCRILPLYLGQKSGRQIAMHT